MTTTVKMKRMIILKSEPKPNERKNNIDNDNERDMIQIHDEQRSIQMTITHRDTNPNAA